MLVFLHERLRRIHVDLLIFALRENKGHRFQTTTLVLGSTVRG